jgi:hypothetical protein
MLGWNGSIKEAVWVSPLGLLKIRFKLFWSTDGSVGKETESTTCPAV